MRPLAEPKPPVTPAVRALRALGVAFESHLYEYEERGGTARSAQALGVPEHTVLKTLVLEDDARAPLLVLMHGDYQVSTQRLARFLGRRSIEPCAPESATRHTGYLVGGTSPFGTRKTLPVYLERSVTELPRVYLNGGKRGYLVSMATTELLRALAPTLVEVGVPG